MMPFHGRSVRVALAILLMLGVAGCGTGGTGPEAELTRARARWVEAAPTAYTITITRTCECLREGSGPVVVAVRNRLVESRIYVESGAAVAPQYAESFPTVDGLFELIAEGIQDRTRPLTARYDPALGYPTQFAIGAPATDAPLYTVTEFRSR